jgi:pimeloyl-ACP methyl ester carboxylesterase
LPRKFPLSETNGTKSTIKHWREFAIALARRLGCILTDDPTAPAFQQAEDIFVQRASTWETLASEYENLNTTQPSVQPTDTREVWAARRCLGHGRRPLGALPLVVLQAGDLSDLPFSSDVRSAYFQVRAELLGSVAAQSKQGARVVVPNATHNIHLDQPQKVIDAVRQVVCAAQGATLSSCE